MTDTSMNTNSTGVVEVTQAEAEQFANAEFVQTIEEHGGASIHHIFDHDHYGYISLSYYLAPSHGDITVAYHRWETEPHHETNEDVWHRRDGWR